MPMPPRSQRVIRSMLRRRWMTATELAGVIGNCPRSVGVSLRLMQQRGEVYKIERRGQHWLWALKAVPQTNPWMVTR